jgi:hypothetical protein
MKLTLDDLRLTENELTRVLAQAPKGSVRTAQVRKAAWAIFTTVWEHYHTHLSQNTEDMLDELEAALTEALGPRGERP